MKINRFLKAFIIIVGCDFVFQFIPAFMFRTGEYYQQTRAAHLSAFSYLALQVGTELPIVGWFFVFPVGVAGCVLDIAIINPIVDTLLLPYDLLCQRHGFYIRVFDEKGNPVENAQVEVFGRDGGPDIVFTSCANYAGHTDSEGLFYIPRLEYCLVRISVSAEGFHEFNASPLIRVSEARGLEWIIDSENRKIYNVSVKGRGSATLRP